MSKKNIKVNPLNIEEIKSFQQNKYPLLFIDAVIDHKPGKWVTAKKNFSYNEWFFPPHYEDEANVPGFILIESLVQAFILTFLTLKENKGNKTNFLDIKKAKFRKKVVPGDTMKIKSELFSFKRGIAQGNSVGLINEQLACSAEFVVSLPNTFQNLTPNRNHGK
tara:strand:+ start:170 stop:661 length:492 start_codon:yes stop_codon:yes gene_type:complete